MTKYVLWFAVIGGASFLLNLSSATHFWGPMLVFMAGVWMTLHGLRLWDGTVQDPGNAGPWWSTRGIITTAAALMFMPFGDGPVLLLGPLAALVGAAVLIERAEADSDMNIMSFMNAAQNFVALSLPFLALYVAAIWAAKSGGFSLVAMGLVILATFTAAGSWFINFGRIRAARIESEGTSNVIDLTTHVPRKSLGGICDERH